MLLRLALSLVIFMQLPLHGDEVGAFIEKWAESESKLGRVRVAFTQEVKTPALKEPVKTPGIFWRLGGTDFRWELGSPPGTILVRQGTSLQIWDASSDKWTALNPSDRRFRGWLSFLGGESLSAEQLSKEFTMALESRTHTLTLSPKSGMARKHLKHIVLQFNSATFHLVRLTVTQADQGTTTMHFSAPERVASP